MHILWNHTLIQNIAENKCFSFAQSKELREIINVKLCVTLVIGLKVLAKVSEVQVILSPPKTEEASSYKNKESYPATKGDL